MILTGQQLGELTKVVISAFSRSDLTMLVRVQLDLVLAAEVSTDEGWQHVVFSFIDRLNQEGRAIELIRVVRDARPKHTDLVGVCDALDSQANGEARPASEVVLRKVIAAFNRGFRERNELFKYLNAYKELHDILHDLQSYHPKLKAAIEVRIADPNQPLEEEVAFYLKEHLETACASVKDIEFPDKPPSWIAKLEAAIQVLTGSEVEKFSRQVERLKTIPHDNLTLLNEKLFENARRLQPKQLIDSLDEILTALGEARNPTRQKIRAEVEEFRNLCSELDDLSNAHNLCQQIDDSLREAAGLSSVTSEELSEWPIAKKSLDELALHRKADKRVQRTNEAAKLFEAANQAQAFRVLVERFDDLFLETDKALLKVTNKLTRKAIALHTALETFP